MKAKRWTAILLSAVLAFSVCMPVSGISTYAAEEAAAETIQPAPEESDSVQTESAASAAEDLTEESSSEDVPAEDGSVVEEEAENAASSEGTQVQENLEDPQEDPVNDAAGEAAQQGGQEPFDAGNEDQEAAPVAGAEQDPDSDGQADSVEASFENEDAAETAAPEQSEAADTVSEGQSAAVDTVSEEQSESADTVSEEQNGAQAEDGQTVITEDSGEEKESVEPTEAAAAQETDFDSAVEISVGQTLTAEVTAESPYAFFKFTTQENGVLSVHSASEFDTYAELFDGNQYRLAYNDDGVGYNFKLEYECSAGETYYVRARQYNYESCSFDVTLEKSSFYVDHSYGGDLYQDPNTELDLQARALADTELTYRWYVNEELRQEGASDSFQYLFNQTPAIVECRIEDQNGHSESVWYYIYANCYWDVYPEGSTKVVVENGETRELKVFTEVQEGHENDYELTYDWMDLDGNLLQRGPDPSYTLTMENGPMNVTCYVYDQYGNRQDVSFLLSNPGWLNVCPDGAREGATFIDTYCESESDITLYVCDRTDGSSPLHYTWYDEEDQVVDGSGDASYCELQSVTKGCTVRCHVEDENGNSADLMFYVHINSNLTVHPEGAEDGDTYFEIDIVGQDSVVLHTIAENSAGSSVTYQWQKLSYDPQTDEYDWTDIEGATQETYTVGNPLYTGQYRCCVQDEDGNSGTAYFYLYAETGLEAGTEEDSWLSSKIYDARNYSEVTFAPWATSNDPDRITWQWAKLEDGSEKTIEGENENTYTVVSPQNGDTYICIVSDGYGREIRLYYYLRQENHLTVAVDEYNYTSMYLDPRTEDDFTLTPLVTADDMSQLTYRWTKDQGGETEVGNDPSLLIHAPEHGTDYHCTVTDQFGNSETVNYYFRINTELRAWPEGMENHQSRSYAIGGLDEITITAFAQAEEGSEFSWQWYHNNDYMDGENGSTESSADPCRISLDVVSPQNGDRYRVEIYDNYSGYSTVYFYFVDEAPALNVYPDGAEEGATFTDIYIESGSDISLYVCNGTDGYFPLHYTWYDEEDQVVDGSGDTSSCELQDVRKSRTVHCHVEDENGNSADLMFYVHIDTYLTVYPEGADEEQGSVWIDIMGQDSVVLHTIAENSAGSAVTYQWQKPSYDPQTDEYDWIDIEGATQETYTVGNPLSVGDYRCCVQDEDGNSGTAYFYLEADTCFEATIGEYNSNSSKNYDAQDYSEVTFTPWATSNDPDRITWQWAKLEDGSEKTIEGENGNTYTVVSPQNGDAYVCIVGDGYGREIRLYYYFRQENHLRVTVDEDGSDSIIIDPRTADDFTLTPLVTADDMSQLTYRWITYQDGETEVGDGPSLFIDHAPEFGTEYCCSVTDQFGNSGDVYYYFRIDTKLQAWPEGMENRSDWTYVIGGLDKITLTAFAQAEEGSELSWQWYHNYEPMEGESGSLESPAEPFSISLDVVSPQNGDEYSLEISDKYGDWRTVRFYLVDEAPALNVYPMGAEEGQDTAVITYDGTTQDLALEVGVAEPTDPGTLAYDWRDPEGNSLGNTNSRWIDLDSPTDGARYSCIVTDSFGQSATVWFELRWERGEDDPTEAEMENASPISVGDTVDVEVTEEAPTAWFRFVPAESGTYELFSTPKSGNEVDTFASLYNSGGMRLHSDDQSAGNNQFSLEYTFEQGENYYFGVRHYGKESCSFTIQLVSGEKSDWLKEYEYRIDGDRIVLTRYTGETAEITVPGHATARGQEYSCIVLSPYIWDSWYYPVTSLSFEEGVSFPDDSSSLFAGLSNLTSIDLQNVDTANVKNMNGMFSSCSSLSSIDLSTFNASGVESCEGVFDNCTNLQTINTPTGLQADAGLPAAFLDESGNIYSALPKNQTQSLTLTRASASENLKDYNYQVVGDKVRLTSYHGEDNSVVVPGNVTVAGKTYNTVEMTPGMWSEGRWNIKNLSFEQGVVLPADCSGLFKGLWYLTTLDLSVLDWSGVTNMESLFEDCSDLTSLNLSGMDEAQNVTNMHRMFSYCGSLTNLDLSSLNTANVTDMSGMFCGCYGFESLDLGGLDTHSVTNMSEMFESCDNLKTINISGFDTANVTDMSYMFAGCSSLTGLDLSGFQTDALTNVRSMFRNCSSLTALDLSSFDASAVEHISYMVKGCSALATINSPVNLTKTTNLPAVYEGSDGTLYGIMPRNLNKSVVLVYSRDFKPGESGDPEALNTVGKAEITLSPASFTYSGTECKPEAKVVFEGKVLTQGTDYIVTYSNNTAAGQAAVTVTGMGIYGGKAVKNFTIAKAALADSGVTVSASGLVYNGKAQTPAVTVKSGSTTLVEGTDYTKTYSNNINAGTASVTVTGKGNYQGAVTKNYTIAKAALANSSATVSASGLVYNGNAQTPAVTVKSGSATLVEGTDYTKAYSNNTNAGTASVAVTGKGNYQGTVTKTFTIAKAAQSITAKAAAATVSVGKTTTVTVTGAKGGVTYSSSNAALAAVTTAGKVTAKKVGSVNITVKAAATANYNAASKTVAIKVVPAATKTLKAANLAKGIKLTWAKVAGASGYIIYRNNKKVKTVGGPAVTWSDTGANSNGTKYVYKVFAKASTGTSTLSKSVTIYRVARPAVSSVKNSASKKMTVKWGKNAKATGYQIQYSLKKNFSGAKTVNVAKAATVSKDIGGLQKGKTYYVRIKTYKKVGKVKYESVWSTAKTVKITR